MNDITLKCRVVVIYIIEELNRYKEGKCLRKQVSVKTKRIQRLIYFCDIEYMKKNNGIPLFKDNYYAWPSGPVIVGVYNKFMVYIDRKLFPMYKDKEPKLSDDIKQIINEILESTKDLDTIDLEYIVKVNDGPYSRFYNEQDPKHEQIIPKKRCI